MLTLKGSRGKGTDSEWYFERGGNGNGNGNGNRIWFVTEFKAWGESYYETMELLHRTKGTLFFLVRNEKLCMGNGKTRDDWEAK